MHKTEKKKCSWTVDRGSCIVVCDRGVDAADYIMDVDVEAFAASNMNASNFIFLVLDEVKSISLNSR